MQRTREIGIRKVVGATSRSIAALLSKDFLRLIVISIIIALPIAWWVMNRWLQAFTYKIEIEWWMFVLSGLLTVSIAIMTISIQAIKAVMMNPLKSLRSE